MLYVAEFDNKNVQYSKGNCQLQNHLSVQPAAGFRHSMDASGGFSLDFLLLSLAKHSYGFCGAVQPVGVELQAHSNEHWTPVPAWPGNLISVRVGPVPRPQTPCRLSACLSSPLTHHWPNCHPHPSDTSGIPAGGILEMPVPLPTPAVPPRGHQD
jgi:hypothetical protein